MIKTFKRIVVLVIIPLLLSSCFRMIFGIKSAPASTNEEMNKHAQKWDIDTSYNYLIVDSLKFSMLINEKHLDTLTLNDIKQPLQWQFYDSLGHLEAFVPNCNVGGIPNLKWNRDVFIETYPPTNANFLTEDTITLKEVIAACMDSEREKPIKTGQQNIVVVWSVFMGRQSKVMVKRLNEYLEMYPIENRAIIYINIDDLLFD